MSRSWQDVKADKERRDRGMGRDIDAAREHARTLTNAYVLGHRLAQLQEGGIGQTEVDTIRRDVRPSAGS